MEAIATRKRAHFEFADEAPGPTKQQPVLREDIVHKLDALKTDLEKAKNDKKSQKAAIQEWMDNFKLKNGYEATKSDKETVRPLFAAYKDLEKQCKDLLAEIDPLESKLLQISASSLAELEPRIGNLEQQIEKKTNDRKSQKHRIQAWLDDFKLENGREATKEDKERVRPMFNLYKELERDTKELALELEELKHLREELKSSAPSTKGDLDKTQMALMTPGAGSVMDKTVGADQVAPTPKTPKSTMRVAAMQERFRALAQQQEQLVDIVDEMLMTDRKVPTDLDATQPLDEANAKADAGSGVGSKEEDKRTVASTMEMTSLLSLLEPPKQPGEEDPSVLYGPESDFAKDAARQEEFLLPSESVPAPRLLELHDVVLDLRRQMESEVVADYLGTFEEKIPEEEIVVAKIPIEEIERKEKMMEEFRVQYAEEESRRYKKRELDLAWREHMSRVRLVELEKEARTRIDIEKRKFIQERVAKERSLERIFIAAKERLEKLIYSQKAHFTEKYGVVEPGQLATGRRFIINWDYEPQPIEMRVHLMRAIKNKLPAGNYCLLLTPYERLGGNPIQWTKLGFQGMGHRRPQATRPVKHKGRFFDTTVRIDQSVFCLCPSRKAIRPSNVLILELFYLAGKDNPRDQIVGWGALPMCNPRFRIVQGRYKIPMLKGEPTPLIDKFLQIESLYTEDLTSWLCNLYVDVRHLSKEHLDKNGQLYREYDLEYDYVNKKLALGPSPPKLKELDKQEEEERKRKRKSMKKEGETESEEAAAATAAGAAGIGAGKPAGDVKVVAGKELESATDPSHPTYKKDGWAPQSNETWYSKKEELFRHPPRPKKKKVVIRTAPSQALSELASPTAADTPMASRSKSDAPTRMLSSNSKWARSTSHVKTPKSPGAESSTSFGTGSKNPAPDEDDMSESSSESEEEARSSGDEWVLDGGETRPLLMNKELTGSKTAADLGGNGTKVRRRRQEGSRWDADALGIESVVQHGPGDTTPDAKQKRKQAKKEAKKKLHATGREYEGGMEKLTWFKLTDAQEMEYYSMAVAEDPTKMEQPLPQEIMRSKLLYLKTELFADIGLQNHRSTEFWVTICIIATMTWIRMYMHFLGQYLYLRSNGVPVYTFRAFIYSMEMKYISTTADVAKELSVVILGPLTCTIIFCGFMLAGWAMMRFIGQIPDSASKAIAAFGIATALDPLLIFLIDVMAGHYQCSKQFGCDVNYAAETCGCFTGDAFKLYERFQTDENNGITGAFITVIVYAALFLLQLFCLYNYFIFIHMNGRMLDVFKRLHGTSEDFFTPHDFEVTYAELAYICEKARKWTHPKGTRRRIAVVDYELTDPLEPDFKKEITTHLTIYNLEIDGSKTLYRHFLRMPDGTIIELFDVVSKTLGSQFDSLEKLLLSDQNVAGAQARGFFANFLK